jgi:hypothetical protein
MSTSRLVPLRLNLMRSYLEMGPANALRASLAQAGPKEVHGTLYLLVKIALTG